MSIFLHRTRKEAAEFIRKQFEENQKTDREKAGKVHYGKQELRQLLDYIYVTAPKTKEEKLNFETMQADSRPGK